MNFTQLRAFHALARTGRFTKAAEYLHVSQPAITAQIKALERDYDVALFHRQGHNLTLTETGQNLYALSAQVMRGFESARALLDDESNLRAGSLIVATDNPSAAMPVLAALRRQYPKLQISVEVNNSQITLKHLLDHEADVALSSLDLPVAEIYAEEVLKWRLSVLVSNDHGWARRRSIRAEELADRQMVVREQESLTRRLLDGLLERHDIDIERVLELRLQGAVRDAVASGLGIGVELTAGGVSDSRVHCLDLRDENIGGTSVAACRIERRAESKITAFFAAARQVGPTWPTA